MRDLTNLNKLEQYLINHKIPYERIDEDDQQFYLDRHQICVPCDREGREWDAICQRGSYGAEEGLLEIMGTIVSPLAGDSVEGWLTAEDVIARIEDKYDVGEEDQYCNECQGNCDDYYWDNDSCEYVDACFQCSHNGFIEKNDSVMAKDAGSGGQERYSCPVCGDWWYGKVNECPGCGQKMRYS